MARLVILAVLAAATSSAACASSGAVAAGPVPQPFPRPGGTERAPEATAAPATANAAGGYEIAGTALSLRGIPYRDGGSDPTGFDCSGFVWYVFAQHGVQVPRTVSEQYRAGTNIRPDALEAGDLVFFNTKGAGPSHVGMLIGGDEFVHAPTSNGQVRVDRLGSTYWSTRFVGARRVVRSGD